MFRFRIAGSRLLAGLIATSLVGSLAIAHARRRSPRAVRSATPAAVAMQGGPSTPEGAAHTSVPVVVRGTNVVPSVTLSTVAELEARSKDVMCARWLNDPIATAPAAWFTPASNVCDRGTTHPDAEQDALRMLNLFRWLSGVAPVSLDPSLAVQEDSCAVIMSANGQLSHAPPADWSCRTDSGAAGAGSSNITLLSETMDLASTVDSYVNETVSSLGHRRWSLYPQLGSTWFGGGSKASCMHVFNRTPVGTTLPPFVAYPNPGFAPIENFRTGLWSVQTGSLEVSGAQVSVSDDTTGSALAITMTTVPPNFGGNAVVWKPDGWTPTANTTYRVSLTIRGVVQQYRTTPVLCGGMRSGTGQTASSWQPRVPDGATEIAPDAEIPARVGRYVSWTPAADGALEFADSKVTPNDMAGYLNVQRMKLRMFRGGMASGAGDAWVVAAP